MAKGDKNMNRAYKVEYFNGKEWVFVSSWTNAELGWATLGGDTFNYRLVDDEGNVIKEDTQFEIP